jgi:hypothetical protein
MCRIFMSSIVPINKCYKANVVLSSYVDPIISSFSGKELYDWLSSNIATTDLIDCGTSGLCLKKGIFVNVTESLCFLNFDNKNVGNMNLDIICRTKGMDLYECMFRDGTNVAVTIFGSIAIEAASLLYKEIRCAAINLRRDKLWKSFSSPKNELTDHLQELLKLCTVTPLNTMHDDNEEYRKLVAVFNDPAVFDSNRLCDFLSRDAAFSSAWQSSNAMDFAAQRLYFIQSDDAFLLVTTFEGGDRCELDLIERTSISGIENRSIRAVEKIVNFLIYFLWSESEILM